MGLALEFEMTDFYGNDFRFRVYDANYASTAITPQMNDFNLVYTPSDDTLLSPIITSELTLDFYDNGESGLAARIASIEESEEPEITISMEMDSGSGYEFWWAGIVEKESIVRYNEAYPKQYTLRASDGISRLKDIRYIGTSGKGAPYQVTPAQVILECLALSELDGFWGSSDPYFRESIEWLSNDLLLFTGAESPMLYTRMSVLHFRDKVNDTEFTWKSAYDCIEAIMKLWGAQLLHANGSYYIRQPRNFENPTHGQREINKLLSSVSYDGSVNNDAEAAAADTLATAGYFNVLAGGEFHRADPLDKVRAKWSPKISVQYTGNGQDTIDNLTKGITWTIPIGTITGGTDKRITVHNLIRIRNDGKWEYKLTVKITLPGGTTYYIDHDPTTNDFTWSTSSSSEYVYYGKGRAVNNDFVVRFTTPEIPSGTYTSCEVEVSLEFWDRGTGARPTNVGRQRIYMKRPEILVDDEAENSEEREVEVDNPLTSNNSRVLDLGDVWFNDDSYMSSYNTFEINESGPSWVDPTTWDCGFDSDTNLVRSMMIERMGYQRTAVEIYRGSLDGFARPHLSVVYDGTTYCMRRYNWHGKLGRAEGEWWELAHATTSITIGDERVTKTPDGLKLIKPPIGDDTHDDRHYKMERIGELGGVYNVSDGAITSIDLLNEIGHSNVRDGDSIAVISPLTGEILHTFEASADAASSATSISVASDTPTYDLSIGDQVMFVFHELKTADNVRGQFMRFMDTHTDASAPPSSLYQSSTLGGLAFKDSGGTSALVGGSGGGGSKKATIAVSSSEIKALNGTPKTLIAAPGAGSYIRVIDAYIDYTYDSVSYNGDSNWIIEYSGGQHIGYHHAGAPGTGGMSTADYLYYTSQDTSAVTSTAHAITWETKVTDGVSAKQTDGDTSRIDISESGTHTLSAAVVVQSSVARPQIACEVYVSGVATGIIRGSSYIRSSGISWDYWVIEIAATKLELLAGDYVQLYVYQVTGGTYGAGGTAAVTLYGNDKSFINIERNNVPVAWSDLLLGTSSGQARFAIQSQVYGDLPVNEALQLTCDTDLATGDGDADVVVLYEKITI
jgi:hypothetical protein